tara:strand:+ start:4801 stop:5028 length:228 start_codon:yes stop_codon:yes gene_type:complete
LTRLKNGKGILNEPLPVIPINKSEYEYILKKTPHIIDSICIESYNKDFSDEVILLHNEVYNKKNLTLPIIGNLDG